MKRAIETNLKDNHPFLVDGDKEFDVIIQHTTFFINATPSVAVRDGIRVCFRNLSVWNSPRPKWYQIKQWIAVLKYAVEYLPHPDVKTGDGVREND